MKVLVDTVIWSLALRRKQIANSPPNPLVSELTELVRENRVILIGPIRQELLSGISKQIQFDRLKSKLNAFKDLKLTTEDYELAAEFYNRCRRNGIQGSHIDFLICSTANRNGLSIFTTDNDFHLYSKHIDISLHTPRGN